MHMPTQFVQVMFASFMKPFNLLSNTSVVGLKIEHNQLNDNSCCYLLLPQADLKVNNAFKRLFEELS